MAAASQSVGAAPGIRGAGFRGPTQQALGWRKGVRAPGPPAGRRDPGPGPAARCVPVRGGGPEPEPALRPGEGPAGLGPVPPADKVVGPGQRLTRVSRSGPGSGSGPGPAGSERAAQTAVGEGGGGQRVVQAALGEGGRLQPVTAGSDQVTRSALGQPGGSEQVTQSTPGQPGGSEQVTQSTPGQPGGSERVTQSTPGQSDRSERVTQSTPGQPGGSERVTQSTPGQPGGSERVTQSTPGQSDRSEQVTQSTPGQGDRSEQVTQSTPGQSDRSEQVTQSTPGQPGGLEQVTQSTPGQPGGSEQVIQSTPGQPGGSEQVTQSTPGQSGGLDQVTQSALSKSGALEQVTQSTPGQSDRSGEVAQSTLGQGGGSGRGIQPVDGCSSESEEQVQFVISDCGSEKGIHCARGNGLVPEQPNSLMKGMNLAPDSRIGSAVGLELDPEEGAPTDGVNLQPVHPNLSAVHGATRLKEQVKLAPFQDARSAWGKKLEQCPHLPLAGSRSPKQQVLPFKYQDMESSDPAQKVGLEQFFITLTQSLSHLLVLCDSGQLGSHLGPGKRDWPSRPTVRKRAKSCPGSPAKRQDRNRSSSSNRVRFADSFGLELTEVRSFDTSEDPTVPAHVLASFGTREPTEHVIWVHRFRMEFTNPKDDENFSERVNSQKVCLEAVTESELVIRGTILVINLAYQKEVTIRYTCTDWRLFTDVSALFESNVEGRMDRFLFTLNPSIHMLQPGCYLQFAIRYNVEGVEFWDNNNGSNYKMTYQSLQVTVPSDSMDRMVDLD